jgi:hypothetical protein
MPLFNDGLFWLQSVLVGDGIESASTFTDPEIYDLETPLPVGTLIYIKSRDEPGLHLVLDYDEENYALVPMSEDTSKALCKKDTKEIIALIYDIITFPIAEFNKYIGFNEQTKAFEYNKGITFVNLGRRNDISQRKYKLTQTPMCFLRMIGNNTAQKLFEMSVITLPYDYDNNLEYRFDWVSWDIEPDTESIVEVFVKKIPEKDSEYKSLGKMNFLDMVNQYGFCSKATGETLKKAKEDID